MISLLGNFPTVITIVKISIIIIINRATLAASDDVKCSTNQKLTVTSPQYYTGNRENHLLIKPAISNCPNHIVQLTTDPDRRFEFEIFEDSETMNTYNLRHNNLCASFGDLKGNELDSKQNCVHNNNSPCNQVLLYDEQGWSGPEPAQANLLYSHLKAVTPLFLQSIQVRHIVSRSTNISILICSTNSNQESRTDGLINSFRTPLIEQKVSLPHTQTFNAPWFPTGYIRTALQYNYTIIKPKNETVNGTTFKGVLIDFDDLDLEPEDYVSFSDWTLKGHNRKSMYVAFNDFPLSDVITLSINIHNHRGKWTNKLGWKFKARFLELIESNDVTDYYFEEETDLRESIVTYTQYVNVTSSLATGNRLTVTAADHLIDRLYVFHQPPPGIRLSLHIIVFTQNKPYRLLMTLRDGYHSNSPLIADITSSLELENQPKYGYVLSTGAYVRIISQVQQFSIITFVVTPFKTTPQTNKIPSQCCAFPSNNTANRGGFLCSRVMRCIPANSACDTIDNCGDGEDESTTACRGERLETYGMTARNVCQLNAKTVLCPWGKWVSDRQDCFPHRDSTGPSALTLAIAVLAGLFAVGLSAFSLYYRRRVVFRRTQERHAQQSQQVLRGRALSRHLDRQNLQAGQSRVSPSSSIGYSNLLLQLHARGSRVPVLPPSYAEVQIIGKAPPAYRETESANVEDDGEFQGDHPPPYEVALSHQLADDLITPPISPNSPVSSNTSFQYGSSPSTSSASRTNLRGETDSGGTSCGPDTDIDLERGPERGPEGGTEREPERRPESTSDMEMSRVATIDETNHLGGDHQSQTIPLDGENVSDHHTMPIDGVNVADGTLSTNDAIDNIEIVNEETLVSAL